MMINSGPRFCLSVHLRAEGTTVGFTNIYADRVLCIVDRADGSTKTNGVEVVR